jgi:hypothetical protein
MNTPIQISSQTPSDIPSDEICIANVKAHLAKGDKARDKAHQHYGAAGNWLNWLKAKHDSRGGTWDQWVELLRDKVGIGKSRASELMQIADRAYLLRRGGETVSTLPHPQLSKPARRKLVEMSHQFIQQIDPEGEITVVPTKPKQEDDADYSRLIDALARSTPETRRSAFMSLASGRHQNDLPAVMEALSDLYSLLARVGRQ